MLWPQSVSTYVSIWSSPAEVSDQAESWLRPMKM